MEKLIIDTDIGDDIDDAYALALLARYRRDDVLGVTTVYKNTEERAKIAKFLFREWGIDWPIYAGEDTPECMKYELLDFETGALSGNGKPRIPQMLPEMENETYESGDAVDFILECAERYPGEVTLVGLGPFTNVGAACRKNPAAFNKLGRIIFMGGSVNELYAEWNVRCDVENAARVFESKVPVYLVGFDITRHGALSDCQLERLKNGNIGTLWRLTELYITLNKGKRVPVMHDPLAVSALLGDFLTFDKMKLRLITGGPARGMTIADENGRECYAVTHAKTAELLEFMVNTLTA